MICITKDYITPQIYILESFVEGALCAINRTEKLVEIQGAWKYISV